MTGIRIVLLALAGAFFAQTAAAGPIFLSGALEEGRFIGNDAKLDFAVTYSTTRATVGARTARTTVTESVIGPDTVTAAVMVLPLPPMTEGESVHVEVDGKRLVGRFLAPKEATGLLEGIARETKSAKVLVLVGQALFIAAQPLGPRMQVEFRFEQGLEARDGLKIYAGVMPRADFASAPVRRAKVRVELAGSAPLRAIFSPSHELHVERSDLQHAIVRVAAEGLNGGQDLRLFFVEDTDAVGLRVLTHRAEGEDAGYFMVVGNPSGAVEPTAPLPKDIVLVVDTSGSMRGEKMEQAREAVIYCLDHLNPGDRFNVVTFGSAVTPFADGLTKNTPAHRAAARRFIEDSVALGRTHISGALKAGLAGVADPTRPRLMIFLTDGTPTAGEMNPERILDALPKMNTAKTRIFVMGVGKDVNTHLLDRLAQRTDGRSVYVPGTEAIDERVASLYDSLSQPVLDGVELTFGGLKVDGVYPKRIPSLFKGGEVMVFGRYTGGGEHTVTLSGTFRGKRMAYTAQVDFPRATAPEDEHVAALWAARRVGDLLGRIRLEGQKAVWIEELVKLSQSFGILTEYTRFMVDAAQPMPLAAAQEQAKALLHSANSYQSGGWAVSQSSNESGLRNKKVQSMDNNRYIDRRGKAQASTKVRQVGRRAFYKRAGRWTQADDGRKRKKRRVKRFSKEYMKMARDNADFAATTALDADVTINVGDEQVEIY